MSTKTQWAVSFERYVLDASDNEAWIRTESIMHSREGAQRTADWINEKSGDIRGRDAYLVTREVSEWVRA